MDTTKEFRRERARQRGGGPARGRGWRLDPARRPEGGPGDRDPARAGQQGRRGQADLPPHLLQDRLPLRRAERPHVRRARRPHRSGHQGG